MSNNQENKINTRNNKKAKRSKIIRIIFQFDYMDYYDDDKTNDKESNVIIKWKRQLYFHAKNIFEVTCDF